MNCYVQKIKANVPTLEIELINDYIRNLDISDNSKRMYIYWFKKYATENEINIDGLYDNYKQEFKTDKDYLTFDEIENIKKYFWNDEIEFIFCFLLESGMRISEFLSLTFQNLSSRVFSIKTLKNKNEYRVVSVNESTFVLFQKLRENNFDFSKLTKSRIHYLFGKLEKLSNSKTNITPHSLRRSKGSLLRMNGVDIETIADILGHKNIEITRKYYSKLNEQYIDSISQLSNLRPSDSIEIQSLREQNYLLKKKIALLEQELINAKKK